jgi:hypothetical protein
MSRLDFFSADYFAVFAIAISSLAAAVFHTASAYQLVISFLRQLAGRFLSPFSPFLRRLLRHIFATPALSRRRHVAWLLPMFIIELDFFDIG